MKKLLFCSIQFLLLIATDSSAQPNTGKAYKKGHSTLTIGYGIGNVWKVFLDKIVDIPEYKVKSSGPYTLVYEYGILQRFSVGAAAGYSRVRGKAEKYQLADQITFLSLLVRANYHIWTTSALDPYFGGGIGINNSKYKNLDQHTIISNPNSKVPNTIDFSGQVGIKYFPAKKLGVNIEAGYINGAIILVGVTTRF
ncbi:MAG: porin family protein [Ferruginibacter sp.]|nr:porin family protein [Ferruginibacter sp.]